MSRIQPGDDEIHPHPRVPPDTRAHWNARVPPTRGGAYSPRGGTEHALAKGDEALKHVIGEGQDIMSILREWCATFLSPPSDVIRCRYSARKCSGLH